jgi:ribosome-binding factor A
MQCAVRSAWCELPAGTANCYCVPRTGYCVLRVEYCALSTARISYLCTMDSTRQQKFSRLIQKEIAEIFQFDIKAKFGAIMITVTQVRVSPDLGVAKIYVSLFPVKEKDKVLDLIRKNTAEIRGLLGKRIRHQARVIPELIFYVDDSLDYAEHIDNLLKK